MDCLTFLCTRLDAWSAPDRTGAYAARMWRHALAYHARPETERADGSGALPYLPIEPETLGVVLSESDPILDVGCLGGYGLFDLAASRQARNLPSPRLFGVDVAESSVALARYMAGSGEAGSNQWSVISDQWNEEQRTANDRPWTKDQGLWTSPRFMVAAAEELPFQDGMFRVVIARLLLPYVDMAVAMREMVRVLADDGLLCLQTHGPRYYLRRLKNRKRVGRTVVYALRALLAGGWMRMTGRQIRFRLFRETALTEAMLRRLAGRHGLSEAWSARDPVRPFAVYGRRGGGREG